MNFKRKLEPRDAMKLRDITLDKAIELCWNHYISEYPDEEQEKYQFERYITETAEDEGLTEKEFLLRLDFYTEVLKPYNIIEDEK